MILRTRQSSYQPWMLKDLLETDCTLFEHWTHDASILPIEYFPHWKHRFVQNELRLRKGYEKGAPADFYRVCAQILHHIKNQGPTMSRHFGAAEVRSSGGWWNWSPSKVALEWLWRIGVLSISGRVGFQKNYDLTERMIPTVFLDANPPLDESTDWANDKAIDHLGFGTVAQIAGFWKAVPIAQTRLWAERGIHSGALIKVNITAADSSMKPHVMRPETLVELGYLHLEVPITRLLSPFDPALRDRARALKLFGFDYRIEVFVPEAKRVYGYYVFPVLAGADLIGRVDAKADRKAGVLNVRAFWPERLAKPTQALQKSLTIALQEMAEFSGLTKVDFENDWLRTPK
jgi:uncharacterized protein YcaQ